MQNFRWKKKKLDKDIFCHQCPSRYTNLIYFISFRFHSQIIACIFLILRNLTQCRIRPEEFPYLFSTFLPGIPLPKFFPLMYPALTLLDQYARFQLIHGGRGGGGGYSPRQMANGKHYSLPYQPSQNHITVLRVIQYTIYVSKKISLYREYVQKLIHTGSLVHDMYYYTSSFCI